MNKEKVVFKGLNFCQMLTLVFVVAKILGYVQWSWVLVFSPVIIDIGATLICIAGVALCNSIMDNMGIKKWK